MKNRRNPAKNIVTEEGVPTGFKVVIPPSVGPGETFQIGSIRFRNDYNTVRVLDQIPSSWSSNHET